MKPDWEGFGKAVMEAWPLGDLDGGELQETAEQYGILLREPYDPKTHGYTAMDDWGVVPGDPWFVRNYEED